MPPPVRLAFPLLFACLSACTAPDRAGSPASAPPATVGDRDAAAPGPAGADPATAERFRARGNEPFWAIDVEGDTLHYVTPDMPEGRTLHAQRMPHAKGMAFPGADEGRPFNLDLTRTACTDSMSGQAFEFTATWDYDGRRMEGCANRSD